MSAHNRLQQQEMLAHLPLFTHRQPEQVALLGGDAQQARELLKHETLIRLLHFPDTPIAATEITDPRWQLATTSPNDLPKESLDSLIIAQQDTTLTADICFQCLRGNGILLQPAGDRYALNALAAKQKKLYQAGFHHVEVIQLPLYAAFIASRNGLLKRPREKAIFNKSFTTHYYNIDLHRAAFALPEFMHGLLNRERLEVLHETD